LAAPPLSVLSLPGTPRSLAVPVNQNTLPNIGKVSEVLHAGSYTYLHAMSDGKGTWLAIPQRDVPVAAEIRYANGALMKDFHSSSLDRTFEEVLFLSGVEVAGETAAAVAPGHQPTQALPPGHQPTQALPPGHAPVSPAGQPDLPNGGEVSETFPAGTYTYLHVVDDGKGTWLAIPRRDIPVGARVRYADETPMKDFYSPSLDRTFAEVLFLGGVSLAED
jgi:hypothetical protein